VQAAERFGADALRFFLLDSFPTGRDGEFSYEQFIEHVNTHLANKLGNLASRTVTLVHKYFGGQVPTGWDPASFTDPAARAALDAVVGAAQAAADAAPKAWEEVRIDDALDAVWTVVERANEFTDRAKPWELGKSEARRTELSTTLAALLEVLRLAAIGAWPVMPVKCEALWTMLGLPGTPGQVNGDAAKPYFGSVAPRALGPSQILFPRIDVAKVAGAS
jgi:methionyl-tRNA synthetase